MGYVSTMNPEYFIEQGNRVLPLGRIKKGRYGFPYRPLAGLRV
jgi:hypothetical protein